MSVVEMVWSLRWKFVMDTALPFFPFLVSFSGVLINWERHTAYEIQ